MKNTAKNLNEIMHDMKIEDYPDYRDAHEIAKEQYENREIDILDIQQENEIMQRKDDIEDYRDALCILNEDYYENGDNNHDA